MLSAGLPREVTVRPQMPSYLTLTDSMSLLQTVKSRTGSPNWHVSMFDIHLRKKLWVYCPGHAGLPLGRSEVLRILINYLRVQGQGHHTIGHLEERARGVERGSTQRSSFRGRERVIRQLDQHWNCFKGNLGETRERRGGAHMGLLERIDTILN